jgi:hypothetical protein
VACQRRAQSHAATVPPSTDSKRHASRSQKVQIVVLASCQHHLYTSDLHQMVLHRPVECTRLYVHWEAARPSLLAIEGLEWTDPHRRKCQSSPLGVDAPRFGALGTHGRSWCEIVAGMGIKGVRPAGVLWLAQEPMNRGQLAVRNLGEPGLNGCSP